MVGGLGWTFPFGIFFSFAILREFTLEKRISPNFPVFFNLLTKWEKMQGKKKTKQTKKKTNLKNS